MDPTIKIMVEGIDYRKIEEKLMVLQHHDMIMILNEINFQEYKN